MWLPAESPERRGTRTPYGESSPLTIGSVVLCMHMHQATLIHKLVSMHLRYSHKQVKPGGMARVALLMLMLMLAQCAECTHK
ncbi:hypothetical protein BN1708_005151 [Verticillium longisporum]|uniref:Uncharacterized protein n=1 Tax=Verticillium longisporum TaxID=100787 RepID=A0A0G4M8B2_VERLO|nr:hypothetical protein BN1708_005151 [Verticillium longisporum]